MEHISLILSDLDGTLFQDDKTISDFTKKVIARAQRQGMMFGIATSRAGVNAVKFLDGISPDILITNGGGIVTRAGEKIYSCEFSVEEIRSLIRAVFDVCGSDAVISVDNEKGLYSNSRDELGDKFWVYDDFSDFREPGMKLCIQTLDAQKVSRIADTLGPGTIDFLPFSDIPWYKLSKKAATKEKAIEALCSSLRISPDNIVAFGDDFNDIGMLRLCGRGIAMGNAIAEVKQVADEVCLTNEEDGVARWIADRL